MSWEDNKISSSSGGGGATTTDEKRPLLQAGSATTTSAGGEEVGAGLLRAGRKPARFVVSSLLKVLKPNKYKSILTHFQTLSCVKLLLLSTYTHCI